MSNLPAPKRRGRPPGAKNEKTKIREAMVEAAKDRIIEGMGEVISQVYQQALAGDMSAAKMLLDRGIPVSAFTGESDRGSQTLVVNIGAAVAPTTSIDITPVQDDDS